MSRRGLVARALVFLALAIGAAALLYAAWSAARPASPWPSAQEAADPGDEPLPVASLLGGEAEEGFRRAIEPRRFTFPEDHGPHDGFRTEWWYFTGNLEDDAGRRFGFQLTFFRNALAPNPAGRDSEWATHVAWMAHFAVTDADAGRFHAFERFEREALGLAGARRGRLDVNVGDWSAAPAGGTADAAWRLRASGDARSGVDRTRRGSVADEDADAAVSLDLVVRPVKPIVLQGEDGLSAKGAEPGNASYYYSMTRLASEGVVRIGDTSFAVSGLSWLDREWSTSALGEGQVGWDWFALQLDDGSELMLYRLRLEDGSTDRHSAGSFSPPFAARPGSGDPSTFRPAERIALGAESFRIEEKARWESPRGGSYPAAWTIEVPELALRVDVTPVLADQELDVSVRYWEGAVDVRGERAGAAVGGRGYVELTGYPDAAPR